MDRIVVPAFLGLISLLAAASAFAVPVAHTSRAAFDRALSDAGLSAGTLDFDTTAAGTPIASGNGLRGITFTYDFGGAQMQVRDEFDTTSTPNYLGTNDLGVFQDGDDFDLSFAPINAIGMFFTTADAMLDDDITLAAAGTSVGLSIADAGADLGDGGIPYFLGIVDDMNTFTTASIVADGGPGGPFFFYNVDDIVTTTAAQVPEPSTAALFIIALTGWIGVGVRRRRHRGSGRRAGEAPAA